MRVITKTVRRSRPAISESSEHLRSRNPEMLLRQVTRAHSGTHTYPSVGGLKLGSGSGTATPHPEYLPRLSRHAELAALKAW